jgi:hypothetical protein
MRAAINVTTVFTALARWKCSDIIVNSHTNVLHFTPIFEKRIRSLRGFRARTKCVCKNSLQREMKNYKKKSRRASEGEKLLLNQVSVRVLCVYVHERGN